MTTNKQTEELVLGYNHLFMESEAAGKSILRLIYDNYLPTIAIKENVTIEIDGDNVIINY